MLKGTDRAIQDIQKELWPSVSYDLSDLKPDKAFFKRKILHRQLYSGYLRVDLCEPLLRGNFIVLKGDKLASGKDLVIESAIKHFLQEGEDHRVVYVSLNSLSADHVRKAAESELEADDCDRLTIVSADEYSTGDC